MKIAIQTLECKVNQSETHMIEALIRGGRHEIVRPHDNPDICIINTCTVTAKSDYQSRQLIRRAARAGARVIATGCYAELKPEELSKIEGLDLVIGNSDKESIVDYIEKLAGDNLPHGKHRGCHNPDLSYQPYYSDRSRAFLKIQDGCNFSCSYCAVTMARGKSRSLPPDEVIRAVNDIVGQGYREIVLTGIHIGLYGYDLKPRTDLAAIVKEICSISKDARIRLSSIEPQELSDDLLEMMGNDVLCMHLHIPLQSGSDTILRLMNRRYTSGFYEHLINRIITLYPDISIGTDIIAGFPGEGEKEFNATVKFINKLPLSYIHVFPYSKRAGTEAITFSNHIDEGEMKRRVRLLLELSNDKKKAYLSKQSGRELDVINEGISDNNQYYKAISDNYLRVRVLSGDLQGRDRLSVRVISLTDRELVAEPL